MRKPQRNRFYETFTTSVKTDFLEKLLWGVESIVYIILSFLVGMYFGKTHQLRWYIALWIIILLRFNWQSIKNVVRRVPI